MSSNLIHRYINNMPSPNRHGSNQYATPSISQTVYNSVETSNNLIKPLEGKGYLVQDNILTAPKEFVRDSAYTAKAFYDGTRGKANDHQIGKMNDLGLKIGGLAIATYLLTHKATPKTKAMEFIGFGAFLASMALWPKLAIEIPTKLIHGFNFRQKYIDEQGRKKYATQDPNYIPFDLYRGESKYTDLDLIGDKLGISKDTPNRREEVKDEVRKISVQDNTLWMMTAGIATPVMTALLSNLAEKVVGPVAENLSNKSANNNIDEAYSYLTNGMNTRQKSTFELNRLAFDSKESELSKTLKSLRGKSIKPEELDSVVSLFVGDFEPEMREAAKTDIVRMIGGSKFSANSEVVGNLAGRINQTILAKDPSLGTVLSADSVNAALSEGLMKDAVHDMLSDVSREVIGSTGSAGETTLAELLKTVDLKDVNFFEVTEETSKLTPVERLSYNIQKHLNNSFGDNRLNNSMLEVSGSNPNLKANIDRELAARSQALARSFYEGSVSASGDTNYMLNSVSNLYKSKAPRTPMHRMLFGEIFGMLENEQKLNQGYIFNDSAIRTITDAEKSLNRYRVFDGIFSKGAHLKVEMAPDTIAANSWNDVSRMLIKELGISDKEISVASKSQKLTRELIEGKLEEVCSDDVKYSEFMKKMAKRMAMFDEKMDAPNAGNSGRMMSKIEDGIVINCKEAGQALNDLGMNEMRKKMISSYSETMGVYTGSIMNSKLERLHSRVNGIHSSYMRILQACEFFHRANKYKLAVGSGSMDMAQAAREFGFTNDVLMNDEIIKRGKSLLLSAHTNQFYNKMATINNPEFFKSLMSAVYRPEITSGTLNPTESTIGILDEVRISDNIPRRTFEKSADGRKLIGQSLKEFMSESYASLGSIGRRIVKPDREALKVDTVNGEVTKGMQRATERFNLLGKAPSEMLHDALKQTHNSRKWMKIFAPILAATYAVTVGAQFLFGNTHKNVNS